MDVAQIRSLRGRQLGDGKKSVTNTNALPFRNQHVGKFICKATAVQICTLAWYQIRPICAAILRKGSCCTQSYLTVSQVHIRDTLRKKQDYVGKIPKSSVLSSKSSISYHKRVSLVGSIVKSGPPDCTVCMVGVGPVGEQ